MKRDRCSMEDKINSAARSGQWSESLLSHFAACPQCEETVFVSSYLRESAATSAAEPLPDAGRIWRKAQVASNAAIIERAVRPILWARRFAFAAAAAAAIAFLGVAWPSVARFFAAFAEASQSRPAPTAEPHDSFLFSTMILFLVALFPLILGLYSAWAED